MVTTPDQIDRWRQSVSEHQRLEFKEAKTQFDNNKLYEYCVALANEGGGFLLLGVEDKPPRRVVGTKACNNTVAMTEKLFQAVGFRVDIEEVHHPDGRVLVFHIPSRPRGTAYHLDGKYLMRSGEALVPMTEDQLRRIFAEVEPGWLEEHSKVALDTKQVADGGGLPVAGTGFPFKSEANDRYDFRADKIRIHGPGRSGACLLSALLPQVCHGREDVEPKFT